MPLTLLFERTKPLAAPGVPTFVKFAVAPVLRAKVALSAKLVAEPCVSTIAEAPFVSVKLPKV